MVTIRSGLDVEEANDPTGPRSPFGRVGVVVPVRFVNCCRIEAAEVAVVNAERLSGCVCGKPERGATEGVSVEDWAMTGFVALVGTACKGCAVGVDERGCEGFP